MANYTSVVTRDPGTDPLVPQPLTLRRAGIAQVKRSLKARGVGSPASMALRMANVPRKTARVSRMAGP